MPPSPLENYDVEDPFPVLPGAAVSCEVYLEANDERELKYIPPILGKPPPFEFVGGSHHHLCRMQRAFD